MLKLLLKFNGGIQAPNECYVEEKYIRMSKNGVCDGDVLPHSRTAKCCPKGKNTEGIWGHWSDSVVEWSGDPPLPCPSPYGPLLDPNHVGVGWGRGSWVGKETAGLAPRSFLGWTPPSLWGAGQMAHEAHPRIMR